MNPFDIKTPIATKNPFNIGGDISNGPRFTPSITNPSFNISQSTPQVSQSGTPQFFPAILARDTAQGVARTVASVGITAGNAPTKLINDSRLTTSGLLQKQPLPFQDSIDTSSNPITNAVFGGQPVQTVQKNISDTQKKLEPYIGKVGSNLTAPPLILGSIALDLSGFGGGKAVKLASDEIPEAFFKAMVRESSPGAIEGTLRKIGMDETLAKTLAPKFAESKTVNEAKSILADFGKTEPVQNNLFESSLTQEAKKYKSAEEFIKTIKQPEIPDDVIKTFVNKKPKNIISENRIGDYNYKTWQDTFHEVTTVFDGEKPIGFLSKTKDGVVSRVGVLPEYRNQGVGQELYKLTGAKSDVTAISRSGAETSVRAKGYDSLTDFYNKANGITQTQPIAETIAQSKNPTEIAKILETTNVDKAQIPQMSKVLASVDSPKKVNNIIEGFDSTRTPKKSIQLSPELEQKQNELEIKKETLNNSPFKSNQNKSMVDREGRIKELGNEKNPAVIRKMENRMAESGVSDPAEFSAGVEKYFQQKNEVKQLESSFNKEKKQFIAEQKANAKVRESQGKVQTPQPDELAMNDNFANIESLLTDLSQGKTILDKELETIRSLPPKLRKEIEPLSVIIQKEGVNIKQKVGFLDYLRTPEKVLEKIGVGDLAKKITNAYDAYLSELPKHIDTITEWSKKVDSSRKGEVFDYLDGKPVQLRPNEVPVVKEIQDYLADWADRLGLSDDNRISHYITHIFEKDFIKKEFDQELANIISDKIPGQVYDPFLEERLGKMGFVRDPWRALDAYTKRATRKVNMDPVLEEMKNRFPKEGSEESQFNYIKRYADKINMRPGEIDNLVDNQIKQLFGYKFGQRPVANITKKLRQMVFRGGIGANVGSAFRNLSQGANTYAVLGEKYTTLGYAHLMKNGVQELKDNGILLDNFVEDRSINATKKLIQKIDKGLFYLFDTAEKINRGSAYYGAKLQAINKGATEEEAIDFAKHVVAQTQFRFSPVDTPVALQGDLVKVFTQFMTYPVKQTEFLAELAKSKSWGSLIRYLLGSFAIMATVGKLYGGNWGDINPTKRFSEDGGLLAPIPKTGVDILQLFTGSKDKFNQPEDFKARLGNVIKDLTIFVPGGAQAKKTIQGLSAVSAGKDVTATGKTRYNIPQTPTNYVRASIFGKYNFPEAEAYYNQFNKPAGSKTASGTNPFNR
jgi:hypothetical protein